MLSSERGSKEQADRVSISPPVCSAVCFWLCLRCAAVAASPQSKYLALFGDAENGSETCLPKWLGFLPEQISKCFSRCSQISAPCRLSQSIRLLKVTLWRQQALGASFQRNAASVLPLSPGSWGHKSRTSRPQRGVGLRLEIIPKAEITQPMLW